eukprot:10385587-Karenia_brevis.AAC.1
MDTCVGKCTMTAESFYGQTSETDCLVPGEAASGTEVQIPSDGHEVSSGLVPNPQIQETTNHEFADFAAL